MISDLIKKILRQTGLEITRYRPSRRAISQFHNSVLTAKCEVVADVGANKGQFAEELRKDGYIGKIISFEPLSEEHDELLVRAKKDERWIIAPRCAIGSTNGSIDINIAENRSSSSLLIPSESLEREIPISAVQSTIPVPVRKLDSILPECLGHKEMVNLALKVDTQGYEMEVFKGGKVTMNNVSVLMLEMRTTLLYEGESSFRDLLNFLSDCGLSMKTLQPTIYSKDGHLLEMDVVFERIVNS